MILSIFVWFRQGFYYRIESIFVLPIVSDWTNHLAVGVSSVVVMTHTPSPKDPILRGNETKGFWALLGSNWSRPINIM